MQNLRKCPVTFSVQLLEDGWVRVSLIGGIFNDQPCPDTKDMYPTPDDLPAWMQDQIAALCMCEPDPSNNIQGVGRRLGHTSFWVEYHEGA